MIGQQHLVILPQPVAVTQHGGGVKALGPHACRVTNHQGDAIQLQQLIQRGFHCRIKAVAQQQVFRAVAGQRQLGRDQHRRATLPRQFGQTQNFGGVAGNVTDHRVELSKGDTHGVGGFPWAAKEGILPCCGQTRVAACQGVVPG